jgi:uncharacterized damage-inducible protein DinB
MDVLLAEGASTVNKPLAEMLRYNKWATRQLLEAARTLPEHALDHAGSGVSGSVRELLLHIVGGQQTFVLRTMGRQHEGELTRWSAWPGLDPLIEIAVSSSDDLIRTAENLEEDAEVDLPFRGKVHRYPRSFFLVHAVEHGVEHRTEIKVALKQLGIDTPDLDAWPYSVDAGYGTVIG